MVCRGMLFNARSKAPGLSLPAQPPDLANSVSFINTSSKKFESYLTNNPAPTYAQDPDDYADTRSSVPPTHARHSQKRWQIDSWTGNEQSDCSTCRKTRCKKTKRQRYFQKRGEGQRHRGRS